MRSEGKTRLLDVGAGTGHSAAFFVEAGLSVVAIDLSPVNVEHCLAKGVTAQVGDFYKLEFENDSFDALWVMSCLMHAPNADLPDVLTELARVLAPGGIAMFGLWGGSEHGEGASGVLVDDDYAPPRFFALRTDQQVTTAVGGTFTIERFETLRDRPDDPAEVHYQLIEARKP